MQVAEEILQTADDEEEELLVTVRQLESAIEESRHQTGAEEVMLDVDVSWAAPLAEAVLAVKLTQGAPPFPVQLSEILFSGTVRIIFRPLMPYWPCFAGVSVSFVGRPQVDFSLRLIGGELMSVPGLAHAMNDLIKHRVLSLMVWPRCVVAPVRKGLNLRNLQTILARPAGILRCHIVQARGLRAKHFTGVYVTLELGGVLRDSRVMGSSVDVGWKRERNTGVWLATKVTSQKTYGPVHFISEASKHDMSAPNFGTKRLLDYYREKVEEHKKKEAEAKK